MAKRLGWAILILGGPVGYVCLLSFPSQFSYFLDIAIGGLAVVGMVFLLRWCFKHIRELFNLLLAEMHWDSNVRRYEKRQVKVK